MEGRYYFSGATMKTIGLIGGMSWESSIEYYRLVHAHARAKLGGLHNAKSVMVTVDFAQIEHIEHDGCWATYAGGVIRNGMLTGIVDGAGALDFRYVHVDRHGAIMTGECRSMPEHLADGRIRLHERWRWTSGNPPRYATNAE
jgi:hypothetical protein